MAWVSPTSHDDPDSKWSEEERAYDEDTGNYAYSANIPPESWGYFLELLHDAIDCDKVRFWAEWGSAVIEEIDLDVYYGGDWHHVYQGEFANLDWDEKTLGGTFSVTKARVKFYNASTFLDSSARLHEFDFNEVAGEKLLTATCSVASSTTGSLTVIVGTLFATSSTISSAAASLSVVKSFSGTSSVISSVTGSITVGWISPTGHNDPDSGWSYEENAYDDELGTNAVTSNVDPETWSTFLELTHAALDCSGFRFFIFYENPWMDEIDIDVFYSDAWHHDYEGSYEYDVWVEKSLSLGNVFSITKARVRFYNRNIVGSTHIHLCEFDFKEAVGVRLLTATCSASSSTSGSLILGKIEAMTAIAATATDLPSTILQLLYSITAHAPPATTIIGSLSVVKETLSGTSSIQTSVSGSLTVGRVEALLGTASVISAVTGLFGLREVVYKLIVELKFYDRDGNLVKIISSKAQNFPLVDPGLEFTLLRDGGCGAFKFTTSEDLGIERGYRLDLYLYESLWYSGRLEKVPEPGLSTSRTYKYSGFGFLSELDWKLIEEEYANVELSTIVTDILEKYYYSKSDILEE